LSEAGINIFIDSNAFLKNPAARLIDEPFGCELRVEQLKSSCCSPAPGGIRP